MKTTIQRAATIAMAASVLVPSPIMAHQGHAGDHGWLWGATQPLLGLDHVLAAAFIVALGSLGILALGRVGPVGTRHGEDR